MRLGSYALGIEHLAKLSDRCGGNMKTFFTTRAAFFCSKQAILAFLKSYRVLEIRARILNRLVSRIDQAKSSFFVIKKQRSHG